MIFQAVEQGRPGIAGLAGAVVVAWLGMCIHNLADLPTLTWSSGENLLPGLVWLLLYGLWRARPNRSWPLALLLSWGLLNLVGGFATVLPLPVLPFRPEQSLRHYGFHVLYALAQLPLLLIVRHELKRVSFVKKGGAVLNHQAGDRTHQGEP